MDEVREGFSSPLRKELIGEVEEVSDERRLLVIFQYEYKKDLNPNQLTTMAVERIPITEETKLPTISVITDDTIIFIGYTIMVSMFCYILRSKEVSIVRRISNIWRQIWTGKRWST